ncbi:MAG: NAD-dependent epimerase/dehydratase family protein [Microbacteriaceae bacterium]
MSRVFVTGGSGFLGSSVVAGLANSEAVGLVVSGDLRMPDREKRVDGVIYEIVDVTAADSLPELLRRDDIDVVVHLASIVNPGASTTVEQEYRVDVEGSRAVFAACLSAGVRRVVVSSSGAAYGYHPDNPDWLHETDELRGNETFAYSRHKRLVEEQLAQLRMSDPELEQVIFRIGTILGPTVKNQITALWDGPRVLEISGSESPFVFVWVDDVVEAMVRAATDGPVGIFNVAGDGKLTVREIASRLGKKTLVVPAWALAAALGLGHALRLTPHNSARVGFLRYRPVLDNTALKSQFGFTPSRTSAEAFDAYLAR